MAKPLDFSKTVYELCKEYPELIGIMQELGFEKIVNPAMVNTVGKVMTIPKGALMRGLNLDSIKKEFIDRGFTILE